MSMKNPLRPDTAPQPEPVDILVVNDEPSMLFAVQSLLIDPAYQVEGVGSGEAALRWLLRRDCAVILLDINMPGMDGFETASLIRQRDQSRNTPIIFTTAYRTADVDTAQGYALGAVDYLFIPIVPEVLRSKVAVFADLFRQRRQLARQVELSAANHALQREIAQRIRTEQELHRSNAELEQFAYVASHDLRAPLRGIRNLTGWIQEELGALALSDEIRENLGLLQTRVRRMEQLIEGLLAYSRIGRVHGNLETLDSGALLAEILDLVQAPAGFRIEIGERMPVLKANRTQFQSVLQNLITNAVKHHDGAMGRIQVDAIAEGDGYRFTVTDDGPGIPPQHRERVFQMFQTLRPWDEAETSGMGLALVRKAVEYAGGTITLNEAPGGRGARFSFTWPVVPESIG